MPLVVLHCLLEIYKSLKDGDYGILVLFRRLLLQPASILPLEALEDQIKPLLAERPWEIMRNIIQVAKTDPGYDGLWRRLAEHLDVLSSLHTMLPQDTLAECIAYLLFQDQLVTDHERRKRCSEFLLRYNFPYAEAIDSQWQEEHRWVNSVIEEAFRKEIRYAMANDECYNMFLTVFHGPNSWDQATWETNYGLVIKSVSFYQPDSVARVSDLLYQLYKHHENTKEEYESYEEYVQREFLDQGGQEYLDAEIDRSQMEHWMSKMSL
ncbi:hypothetical protein CLU79DRAFT_762218 [Phycomyces nitens]|nr:hypothetical protein CLU79DRAFT_762218 [Phycomyces nitens]